MPFAFSPTLNTLDRNHFGAVDFFTEEELLGIVALGKLADETKAQIDSNKEAGEFRDSMITWILPTPNSTWLYKKLADIIHQVNFQHFKFDLWGFLDNLQYTTYEEGGHYAWHVDITTKGHFLT
jgi:hypothetical protein